MTEPPLTRVSGVTFGTANAGNLHVPADTEVKTFGGIEPREYGTAFGPLEITSYPETTATITDLQFATNGGFLSFEVDWFTPDSDDGGGDGWFTSLAPIAAATAGVDTISEDSEETDEPRLSRRTFLAGAGVAITTAGLATTASASDTTYTKAKFELESNEGGIRVRVLDRIENVLPPDDSFPLLVDGLSYDSFVGGDQSWGDIPPSVNGTVQVGGNPAVLAFLKALYGEKAVTLPLELSSNPSEEPAGTELTLTDHDIIVRHAQIASADSAMLEIGNTPIPHYQESSSDAVGWYDVRDSQLVYSVGTNPPESQNAELTLYPSRTAEYRDDARRRF